ncbi:MAG: ankyrin repeat domain-containing protein [Deltaproteobacteria bacterium]|nr:ankyrin repeat domain-containing protein [Deltaproteobacteria bacterium]
MALTIYGRFALGFSLGTLGHILGVFLLFRDESWKQTSGLVLIVCGFFFLMYGGWYMAERKGRHGSLGVLLAFLSIVGLGILAGLPSRSKADISGNKEDSGPAGDRRLFLASEKGNLDEIRKLLGDGVNVDGRDRMGRTALHLALDEGQAEAAKLLLDLGASPVAVDKLGNTPLHLAAELGSPSLTSRLIEMGADVNAQGNDGWTPLHLAASWNSKTVIQLLLDNGAKRTIKNEKGLTPLDQAMFDNPPAAAEILGKSQEVD